MTVYERPHDGEPVLCMALWFVFLLLISRCLIGMDGLRDFYYMILRSWTGMHDQGFVAMVNVI